MTRAVSGGYPGSSPAAGRCHPRNGHSAVPAPAASTTKRSVELPAMMTAKLGLLALVMVAATGQDADSVRKRFELFNNCQPMRLVIEYLNDDAKDIGLTRERLTLAVESRLRGRGCTRQRASGPTCI